MRVSSSDWQTLLAHGFKSSVELLNFLELPVSLGHADAEHQFKTRVPRRFASLMEPRNPNDPLLLQVLAVKDELHPNQEFIADPLQEHAFNPLPGLIHKYPNRVLLTPIATCAIHCRYCFRRNFPYQENTPGKEAWKPVFDYLLNHPVIHEVILSGGDPLLAKDSFLEFFFKQFIEIPHLKTIRFHTRVPIVLPERITKEFLNLINWLKSHDRQIVFVLHSNHPRELDNAVAHACDNLRAANCHLLNQSVILSGVNDDASILAELSHRLFECHVLPYYLHLLDKVQGAQRFEIPFERIKSIYATLQTLLPGYLVPRLVREDPFQQHKTLVY